MTLFPWTVTVDGVAHAGCWSGVSATEVEDMVGVEARLLCGPHANIHVTIRARPVVPLLQQVEDSGLCPGGDSGAGRPPPDSGSA